MIGTPELTVPVPCATCGGTGKTKLAPAFDWFGTCLRCSGTGVTRTPVTCAGCRWYSATERVLGLCMGPYDEIPASGQIVSKVWGCLSWTAKEGTDGNG